MSIAVSFYYQLTPESILFRIRRRTRPIAGFLNRIAALRRPLALPIWRQAHDIARFEIGQLQPILSDVTGREQIVLTILPLQRIEQILFRNRRLVTFLNG